MSDVQQPMNPFDIFNTKVEEITSFEEREVRDWTKTFFEQDPVKYKKDCTALLKLLPNIYNPSDPTPLRVTYRLPDPDNPTQMYTFVSPMSVGKRCPVMNKWWELYQKGKAGDLVAAQKAKQISRKRYRAAYVQIINDVIDASNNYKIRLIRFPVEFAVEKMIQSKIAPTEDQIANQKLLGIDLKPENVFDIYHSSLLILIASEGSNGRDYGKSQWAPAEKGHGIFIPTSFDDKGKPATWRQLTAADAPQPGVAPAADVAKGLEWLMGEMQNDLVSLEKNWLYEEPDEALLAKVARSLHYIEFGVAPAAEPVAEPVAAQPTPTVAPQPTTVQTSAPAVETPVAPVEPVAAPQPTPQATSPAEPGATGGDEDLLKALGIK